MVTRAQVGIFKPNPKYAMKVESTTPTPSPIPSLVRAALRDPNWRVAMQLEFDALLANNTWSLQDRPRDARIITDKWVFKHKWKPDGSLERYKAG
jgi:histone deacetylase 1/2